MVDVPQVQPAGGIERFLRGGGLIVSATGHCEASAEYESGQGYPDLFHVRFPAPKVRANLAVEAASKRQNSAWRSRGAAACSPARLCAFASTQRCAAARDLHIRFSWVAFGQCRRM